MPLFVILVVTAAKDFFEDYKRRKSDNEENKVLTLLATLKEFLLTFRGAQRDGIKI